MQARKKRWIVAGVGVVTLMLIVLLLLGGKQTPLTDALAVTVAGYTNAPGSDRVFVLFEVKNRAEYDIRLRGDWVEVEGDQNRKARMMNPNLPGAKYDPILKSGEGFLMAVGKPNDEGRWKFAMSYARYGVKEKWVEFSMKHNLPLRIGKLALVNAQEIMSPTNRVGATSDWIVK